MKNAEEEKFEREFEQAVNDEVADHEHSKFKRPACVMEKHLLFLDLLRQSGITNMYGAVPYLRKSFPVLDNSTASKVLAYWMTTFVERHPDPEERNA